MRKKFIGFIFFPELIIQSLVAAGILERIFIASYSMSYTSLDTKVSVFRVALPLHILSEESLLVMRF